MSSRGASRRTRVAAVAVVAAALLTACQPFVTLMPDLIDAAVTDAADGETSGGEMAAEASPRAGGSRCAEPDAASDFARRSPRQVGVDPAILTWALGATDHPFTASVRVYRHNCLIASAGPSGAAADAPGPLFSMTKSIVALGVGRAVTLGKVDLDAPLGDFFADLDEAHGAITLRHLLQQSSGLRFAWANDLSGSLEDSVDQALSMPVVEAAGSHFEYAQTTVNVVAEVVERAVGMDFQQFMSQELFVPIGIEPGTWTWMRDGAGNTQGYAWLDMEPRDVARLATLTLQDGVWDGRRVISAEYLDQMTTGSAANPGYGFLTAVNTGDFFIEGFGGKRTEGPRITSAPLDTIMFSGFLDQDAFIVPSLDLVIVRTGLPMDSRWRYELFHRLMPAFPEVAPALANQGPPPILEVNLVWRQLIDLELLIRRLSTNTNTNTATVR